MGITIKSAGLDLSGRVDAKIIPPVSSNLEYLNFFGGAADIHARNLAPYKPAAALTGALTASATYAQFSQNTNFLTTEVDQVADMDLTFVVVAEPSADNANCALISNAGSAWQDGAGNTGGTTLYFRAGTLSDGQTEPGMACALDDGGPQPPSVALGDLIDFPDLPQVLIGNVDATSGDVSIFNMSAGTSTVLAGSGLSPARGEPFRIGSAYNTNYGADAQISAAAIYSSALGSEERDTLYAWLQTLMLSLYGLSV